jgi:hypothetical protein
VTPRIHSVLIVPGFGHSANDGTYDRGRAFGRYCELDVVDGYLPNLVEELDIDGIRFEVLPTRSRPGIIVKARERFVTPNHMVLHLGGGWFEGAGTRRGEKLAPPANASAIYYGTSESRHLAKELTEALQSWGQCYVWGHKCAKSELDKDDLLLTREETLAARVEPFHLNGPDVEAYMERLPQLGTALGRAISGYLMTRGEARARGVISLENRKA